MARGILITYPGYPYNMSSFMPDNGLANLAGALYAAGHEALILDYSTVDCIRRLFPESVAAALRSQDNLPDLREMDRELERQGEREVARVGDELATIIHDYRPDFVGFKLWNGDGCLGSIALARRLRQEFPRLKIVGGGPHVTFAVRPIVDYRKRFEALNDGTFDAIIQSEAEHLMPALAEFAIGKIPVSALPNALYRDGAYLRVNPMERVPDLDAMAPPIYDTTVYPAMEGDQKLCLVTLDESRGCPYGCDFCIQPVISGRKLRLRSAKSIVDEMERCIRSYGISAFRFAGSATPGKLLEGIATEILARGLKVRYSAFGRVNYARPGSFNLMRQSGLQALFFGVESGSQRILDTTMHKHARVEDMRETLKLSKKAGLFTVASFISPAPGEDEESWQATLDFMADVRPDAILVSPPGPVAGTPWFLHPEQFGFRLGENLIDGLLGFKFKMLFPADQWEYPDYWVDGKDTRQMARECMKMIGQVEQMGLLSMLSDDMYLMAQYCGVSPREYRNMTRRLCVGDYEPIAALVAKTNAAVRAEAAGN